MKEDGHTAKDYQETRDFLARSIVRYLFFKKKEMSYVERELKELKSLRAKRRTITGWYFWFMVWRSSGK